MNDACAMKSTPKTYEQGRIDALAEVEAKITASIEQWETTATAAREGGFLHAAASRQDAANVLKAQGLGAVESTRLGTK
jgi:hypothetical protein